MQRRRYLVMVGGAVLAGCLAAPLPSFGEPIDAGGMVATPHEYFLVETIEGDAEATSHDALNDELFVADVSIENTTAENRRPPWPPDHEVYLFNEGMNPDRLELSPELKADGDGYDSLVGAIEAAGDREALPPDTTVRGVVAFRLLEPLRADQAFFGMLLDDGDELVHVEWQFR